ncbi:hypothetical protein [Clostridium estertheticum]|uniref:hypothetical protein n=1 Tax=Clostridium estertheticum TaxID=238834 RepID=UPI00124F1AC3|nr:hypothetical protein [Clostridium estertheticum]MBZ9618480.1 hypothetical protein [Clostridium estertheticum subsp. laramiense]WAG76284.1 hypothetical protein LL032_22820 [Clostridium estertheticum]
MEKAWGEMLEKMHVGQRAQFQRNIIELTSEMKSKNKGLEEEMKNPNFCYSDHKKSGDIKTSPLKNDVI